MLYELVSRERREQATLLFNTAWFDRATIYAVKTGKRPGRIFVDDPNRPTAGLLCQDFGNYFPAGLAAPLLRRFIREAPAEAGIFSGDYFAYYPLSDAWTFALIEDGQPGLPVVERRSFELQPLEMRAVDWRSDLPPGGSVVRADLELLQRVDRELELHIGDCWNGYDRFLENGFAICLLVGSQIASVVWTWDVSSTRANLSIDTAGGFRRRGLAYLVARAALEHCRSEGLIAEWVCDAENEASGALALKLGFREGSPHRRLVWRERGEPFRPSQGLWRSEPGPAGTVIWVPARD